MVQHISVNGIEMDYDRFGTGERAFVILPGLGVKSVLLTAKAVESAYSMFGEKYTVYLFDRRSNMPDPYPIRQIAQDTAVVMEALGIEGADVFGASLGGMIAMSLALEKPRLVRRMVLGSTMARINPEISGIGRWLELARSGDMEGLTASFLDNLFSENTLGQFKDLLVHMNDDATENDIERFIIQGNAIQEFDVLDELPAITCPTLVIGAEGDKLIPAENSRAIAEALGGELYMYGTEYAHCVFDEAPDYKQRMMDFFGERLC